jgi:hypothetical protein
MKDASFLRASSHAGATLFLNQRCGAPIEVSSDGPLTLTLPSPADGRLYRIEAVGKSHVIVEHDDTWQMDVLSDGARLFSPKPRKDEENV